MMGVLMLKTLLMVKANSYRLILFYTINFSAK